MRSAHEQGTIDATPCDGAGQMSMGTCLPGLALAVAYFVLMAWLYPYRDVFEFDYDEGVFIVMARSLDHGFAMYRDIPNDQPPLISYLTMWWCRLFEWEVNTIRLMHLVFASAIVFAV